MRKILLLMLLFGAGVFYANSSLAQAKTISGVVIGDDDNSPLRDVTITVKGSRNATKTNVAGAYSITANTGDVLVFTFIDYTRQEVSIGASDKINIRLVQAQKQLGEVVVTAYGNRSSKRSQGNATQTVEGSEIAQTQRDNWINALAGRVAGANITPTSGAPGASTSIVLRGATSIGGNNQPLFVVDGVPIDNQTMNQENLASGNAISLGNRNSDYTNRAADINPEDIESVTILKGPEATALYGSDGSSGAIVITTRKGKSGKANVTYNNSFRFEKVYRFPEIQTVYGRGQNGVSDVNATISPYGAGAISVYYGPKYAPNTKIYDNIDAFFRTGFTQKHNVNVEGGSDISTYRLSLAYTDQTGVVPQTGFKNLSIRLGGTARVSSKINISSSFNYVNAITDKATKGAGGYLLNLLNFPSDVDVRDYQNTDGTRKIYRSNATLTTEFDNPFWDVYKNRSQDKVDRLTGNFSLNLDPFKWLNLRNTTGIDFYAQTGDFLVHPQSRLAFSTNGFYSIYEQNTKNISNVSQGTLKAKFGNFSNTFTLGFSMDDNKTRIEAQRGERFYETNFASINNTDPTSRDAKTTVNNIRKVRFFSTYAIGYNNMVYLSLAASREGNSTLTSRQVDKTPFYNFGAASLSFIFTDLKALDKLEWLNYGKARISYGTSGKAPITPYIIDYTFQSQITTGGGYAYGFTGNNFNLKPEYTNNFEFGAELKFFKSRLGLDITRYSLSSKDQIIAARSSYGTGYVIKYFNGGLVENKGIEAILTANPIKKKNFTWDVTVNFDRNRGKIVRMPADLPTYYDSDTWVLGNLRSQAYAGAFTGNLSGSVYQRNSNGQLIINPTTGLPSSTGAEFFIVGDRQPDFKIGFINSFSYKDFSLSFNLDFRKGGDVFNGNEFWLYLQGLSKRTLDRETPITLQGVLNDGLQNTTNPTRNTITVYPYYRSDSYYTSTAVTESDFIESVNWMRLRDATLTYRLPQSIMTRQKWIKSASVFITGTDLFMITNYTGADPSVNANTAFQRGFGGAGIDYGALATPRGINFGCKVQF